MCCSMEVAAAAAAAQSGVKRDNLGVLINRIQRSGRRLGFLVPIGAAAQQRKADPVVRGAGEKPFKALP